MKGGGGSLLREKIVAQATRDQVIVIDETKLVSRLGERMPLPIEVVPFGWSTHLDFMRSLGGEPRLRRTAGGDPAVTDEGNFTLDIGFTEDQGTTELADPHRLDALLCTRAGVIDTGLFLGMTSILVVGRPTGVEILRLERER
jgi:ribose 5-phosphate isomerase A